MTKMMRCCCWLVCIALFVTCSEGRRASKGKGESASNSQSTDVLDSLLRVVNVSYLQCAFHMTSLLRVPAPHITTTASLDAGPFPHFIDAVGHPTTTWTREVANQSQSTRAMCHSSSNCTSNPCGLQWIEDCELYTGIDAVILIGDSTMLRLFQHMTHATEKEYRTKVGALEDDYLQRTIALSSGRSLVVHFIRALHVSTAITAIDHAFKLTTSPRTLMVFSFGPHDTSWLVFRRPMPAFRRVHTGNWGQARTYWNRFTTILVHYIAFRIAMFEERGHGYLDEDHPTIPFPPSSSSPSSRRPVVMFREHGLANCGHPKYSKYPLITRCTDLLMPTVIPHYRAFLAAITSVVNIPTIGVDDFLTSGGKDGKALCRFIDAGHLDRPCHRYELQLIVQAYRMTKTLGVIQGYSRSLHGSVINTIFGVMKKVGLGVEWSIMADLIRTLPPVGYPSNMFRACRHATTLPFNTSRNSSPLCDGAVTTGANTSRDPFDELDLDVLLMDRVNIQDIRGTRCARSGLLPHQSNGTSHMADADVSSSQVPSPESPIDRIDLVDNQSSLRRSFEAGKHSTIVAFLVSSVVVALVIREALR